MQLFFPLIRLVDLRLRAAASVLLIALALLASPSPAFSQAVSGRVTNGTTHKGAAGVQVQYIQLQQGMVPLGNATTDSDGKFSFDSIKGAEGSPALLRVEYQGATYSQPLMGPTAPGSIEISVYDATHEKKDVVVREHAVFLHPAGEEMAVIEQIFLENNSTPPRAYVNAEGTYTFTLPAKPTSEVQAIVEGAAGMPLPQTLTAGKRENSFAITYPIRPGETTVRLQYALPYQSPLNLAKSFDEPAEQTHIVIPSEGVKVTGENLVSAGDDPSSGFTAYKVTPVGNVVRVQVSGQAPVSAAEDATAGQESNTLTTIKDPLGNKRWMLVAALGFVMLGGFVYLYTR